MKQIKLLAVVLCVALFYAACGANDGYEITMDRYEVISSTENKMDITYSDFIFNEVGQVTEKKKASGAATQTVKYEYDKAGNVIVERTETPLGYKQVDYTYDENNQLIKESITSDMDIYGVITYDAEYTNTVDENGNLIARSWTRTDSKYTYTNSYLYDNGGNLASDIEQIDGSTYYVTTTSMYDVYGNLILEEVKDSTGDNAWTNKYKYDSVGTYTISTETDASLQTKDNWQYFKEASKLPMPESVLSTAKQCRVENGTAFTLYTYTVSKTEDCGKYLNILSQICGFDVEFMTDEIMSKGRILAEGKTLAEFSLQEDEKLGLVFAFGLTGNQ